MLIISVQDRWYTVVAVHEQSVKFMLGIFEPYYYGNEYGTNLYSTKIYV